MGRMAYLPMTIELGGGCFECHPDGRVYVRRGARGGGPLRRVKDPEILSQVRRAYRDEIESRVARRKKREAQLEPAVKAESGKAEAADS